tara:strand:+ start:112 stop:4854 length:4743 start_codon:yes stop_codon:yes gene_type:complete
MKSQLNKILKIAFVILFFTISKSYSIEDVTEFTDAITEAREEFENVSAASTDQSKIVDEALKEIDKATEYAQEAINKNNAEDAIKTLEFIEKSLTDVESIIPQEFGSDMSKIDTSVMSKEDMETINELTAQMKSSKEIKEKEFKSGLIEINLKGIDTASISEKLNDLGVNTIKLDIVLDKDKKIETWTKQDWADAYTGSVLTYDGQEVVADKEVTLRMAELETKFQKNVALIENKKNELSLLNSQLNPVSAELESLNEKKSLLTAQYNLEIEKLSTADLTNLETQNSIEISDKLKGELNNITSEISEVEQQSASLKENISKLNLEIGTERDVLNKISSDLANSQKELNSRYAAISSKESELESLLNNDIAKTNDALNQQLNQITREKDFIEAKFEKSIDKEVEALERYYSALGDIESEYFEEEIDFSMREVGVILDADPRKARAFDIERYGTYAGLSQDAIQRGIDAVNKDDWDTQEDVIKEIYTGLSNSKEWVVDTPTAAEFRVMVAEEKAIQAATLASLNVETMNKNWNEKLKEEAKEYQNLAGLNTSTLQYMNTWEGMAEHKPLQAEIDKVLNANSELKNLTAQLQEKQNQLTGIREIQALKTEELNKQIEPLQQQLSSEYAQLNELNSEYYQVAMEKHNYLNEIGGYGVLARSQGMPNYNEMFRNVKNLEAAVYNANEKTQAQMFKMNKISSAIYQARMTNATPMDELIATTNLQREVSKLSMQTTIQRANLVKEARSNLVSQVEEAKTKYNEIMSKENPEYAAVKSKVTSILKDVPTFADKAESLAGLDAVSLRAQLADISAGNKNETAALAAARKAMSEMGKTTGSQYMTGPYWEMSNVKAAAMVRSKKFDHVDDYAYINAYYKEPLQLDTNNRKKVEEGFREFLGKDNPKLNALNEKTASLKSEINNNNAQLSTISADISKIEKEIGTIKSSEKDLKSQIASLKKDLVSRQSLIDKKAKSLSDLKNNLDPINDKITELENQKSELDKNIQNEINSISQNLDKNPTTKSAEIDELNADYKAQMASLNDQIFNFESQAKDLNQTAKALNEDIRSYEIETPQITEQIASLSEQYQYLDNVKANLAMATAKNIGIKVDEKAMKSLGKLEGKAIISIKGTQLVRVVDERLLKEKAMDFIDPISSFSLNTKIYSAEALKPEVFVVEEITQSYSKAKTAREIARENLAAVEAKSGATKEEIQTAEAAVADAKYAEIAAGQAFVSNTGLATAVSQKQTLENLKAIRNTPGMNKWDVRRTEAAIKAAEAQIAGQSYNYQNALSSIKNQETKWNAWRADLYRKDIEIAKAAGKTREASLLQRDLERFQTRLVDERKAFESVQTTQSEYLQALSNVTTKNAALTGVSFQDTVSSSIQNSVNTPSASISKEAKATVQSQAGALQAAGATTQQASAYASAKAAQLQARANWNAAMATGTQAQKQAAEAAFMSARDAASVAGQAAADAAARASAATQAATEAAAVASAAATEVASAASDAAEAAADATRAAQEATLAALQEIEATPGGTTWDAWRAQAAIEQVKAEMEGRGFSYQGSSSYEDAMKEIDRRENSGKSAAECGHSGSGC